MDFEEEPQAKTDPERISISIVQMSDILTQAFMSLLTRFTSGKQNLSNVVHGEVCTVACQAPGRFRRAIPCMPLCLAVLCCFFNFCIPGLGTTIAAFSVWCCSDPTCETKLDSFNTNLLAALLQIFHNGSSPLLKRREIYVTGISKRACWVKFITCPFIVGFVWSIIWGVLFIQIARKWFISSIDNRYSMLDVCPCSRW